MKKERIDYIHKINFLFSEMNALYHRSSLKLGISDSVSVVLYTIYDEGENCLLSDIYKKSGISKQTVNSAVRSLEAKGILYLEQYTKRSKKIVLTEKGKEYIAQTAQKLFEAEVSAFDTWTQEEIEKYISFLQKYSECFRKEVEKL